MCLEPILVKMLVKTTTTIRCAVRLYEWINKARIAIISTNNFFKKKKEASLLMSWKKAHAHTHRHAHRHKYQSSYDQNELSSQSRRRRRSPYCTVKPPTIQLWLNTAVNHSYFTILVALRSACGPVSFCINSSLLHHPEDNYCSRLVNLVNFSPHGNVGDIPGLTTGRSGVLKVRHKNPELESCLKGKLR